MTGRRRRGRKTGDWESGQCSETAQATQVSWLKSGAYPRPNVSSDLARAYYPNPNPILTPQNPNLTYTRIPCPYNTFLPLSPRPPRNHFRYVKWISAPDARMEIKFIPSFLLSSFLSELKLLLRIYTGSQKQKQQRQRQRHAQ